MSQKTMGIGAFIGKLLPYLKLELEQADIDMDVDEYVSMGFVVALSHFIIWTILISIISLIAQTKGILEVDPTLGLLIGPIIGFIFAILILVQVSIYPRVRIKKKIRNLEKNLIFGLRTITVQIRSGVTLFDALSLVADGAYGYLSTEFRRVVDEINTGIPEEEALQHSVMRNPSLFYRRALWQVINGMKAGADITKVLSELVRAMTKEQIIQIKKYSASLRLLSLMYMMLGVIIPALGLTFMIILSTFPQIPITQELLWAFLGGLILAQVMFVGLLKSKRPSLLAEG
ncbi:type II secretion system F family protein [Candidatus Micrarchaeota archaeon]|nr:type II secretion system F family protein [Candidatus Micrarchaeota archaeon]